MTNISFIIPSYNNLRYLKTAYNSIRKHEAREHEIVMLDDASTDGTWEWMNEIKNNDNNCIIFRNETGNKLGHTILYDKGVDLCSNEIFSIFHADMICSPHYVKNLVKHLDERTVVSATRIEPPLHPVGKEKIIEAFGMWPEEFEEDKFLSFCKSKRTEFKDKTTRGIFAPWIMYKKDFQAIGGHDPMFAPYPYEDSDMFNRFILAGYKIVQARDSFVYHLTCRGHKWVEEIGKDADDYPELEIRARRNYLRKWGSWIGNDEYQYPVIPPKYDIGFVVKNCTYDMLYELEPWCSTIYPEPHTADRWVSVYSYRDAEQENTLFDLKERVKIPTDKVTNDIVVEFDGRELTPTQFQYIAQMATILDDSGELGEMELGIFKVTVNKLDTYEKDLVKCKRYYKWLQEKA